MDLYEPGQGSTPQLHDFQPGIARSGLFWTIAAPSSALQVSKDGKTAKLRMHNAAVEDSFQFFAPNPVPARVSFNIKFKAAGATRHYGVGSRKATSPLAFAGDFTDAIATGTFSGDEEGFRFWSGVGPSSKNPGGWAEMGTERNGVFL